MTRAVVIAYLILSVATLAAQDMPAPELIHGKAIPARELADGTVTVRVVREAIGNNIPNQVVTIQIDGKAVTARTDELGRAEFKGLPRDTALRAEATVDGESLVSEPFQAPAQGGLRVILVAGIAEAAERRQVEEEKARTAAPVRGVVTLGGNTRIIGQFQNDALFLFYQLDIVNSARAPVDTGGPFEFELPRRAAGAALMDGSPKEATINGRYLVVSGPFPPGITTVNVQFQLKYAGADTTIEQVWPLAVEQVPVFIERVGNLTLTSPQLQQAGERAGNDGRPFAAAVSQNLAAGTTLTIQLSNLPAHNRLPAFIAIGLACVLLGLGVWLSVTAPTGTASREALVRKRDEMLSRLEDLERKRRAGKLQDDRYLARRQRLMGDLEEVYQEIELSGGRSQGGGDEGVAA